MIYAKLLQLPLFTGMSRDELKSIMSKTKMSFAKALPGNVIARQDSRCGVLLIMTDGEAECAAKAFDGSYTICERITAPAIIQPDGIFGRFQEFTRTLTALTPANTITIEKNEIQRLTEQSLIFRLNLLGTLSTALQKERQELWRGAPRDLETRIIDFLRRRCLSPTGSKTIMIKMQTLAAMLNDSRLDISHALNNMQGQGLLKLSRGKITIPDMHQLIAR